MNYDTTSSSGASYLSNLAKNINDPGVLAKLILWIKLSSGQVPGFRFVHDYSIAGYVIDFYCPSIKLGIDVVGSGKKEVATTAEARRIALEAHSIMLLNFTDVEISEYTEDVLEHIQILATAFDRMSKTG